nr:hypothetical protein Iba_chr02aCG12150 [Ipomoea batatas]
MFECLSGLGVMRRRRAGETRQVMSREKPDEGEPEAGADSRTHDPMESGEAEKENKCLRWSEKRSCGAGEIESAKGNGERLSGDEVIEFDSELPDLLSHGYFSIEIILSLGGLLLARSFCFLGNVRTLWLSLGPSRGDMFFKQQDLKYQSLPRLKR